MQRKKPPAGTKLTSVSIPDGVTVSEGAFCECERLESITIGNDVTLGLGAFMYNNRINGRWQMLYYVKNTGKARWAVFDEEKIQSTILNIKKKMVHSNLEKTY